MLPWLVGSIGQILISSEEVVVVQVLNALVLTVEEHGLKPVIGFDSVPRHPLAVRSDDPLSGTWKLNFELSFCISLGD